MLKLKIQKEPYWLKLGYGVKVKVKPCTSAVFYEAKAYMNSKLADRFLLIGLGIAGILEWDGVMEADEDKSAPLTESKIDELFSNFWAVAENFRTQYCGLREVLEAEKNVSLPAQNGTSAMGEDTVPDVTKTEKSSVRSTNADI